MVRAGKSAVLILGLLISLLPAGLVAENGQKLPDELLLAGQNIIDVEINGRAFRLEVRPDGPTIPTINPDIAKLLRLKPGMIGIRSTFGPEQVVGITGVHKINFGDKPEKKRIMWTDRQASTVADGIISPASLPYKRVVFQLAAPAPVEQSYNYPLDRFGFLGRVGVGTTIKTLEEKLAVQFSLMRNENLVSAPTGNWLAENFGGTLAGAAQSTLVYYGIQRPTRLMKLGSPLRIGDVNVSDMAVRVSDYGDATGISDGTTVPSKDTEEIVVVGKRDKDIDLRLTIGRELLDRCSALTYDFDKRQIRMSCAL